MLNLFSSFLISKLLVLPYVLGIIFYHVEYFSEKNLGISAEDNNIIFQMRKW